MFSRISWKKPFYFSEISHIILNNLDKENKRFINSLYKKASFSDEDRRNIEEIIIRSNFPNGVLSYYGDLIDKEIWKGKNNNKFDLINQVSLKIMPITKNQIDNNKNMLDKEYFSKVIKMYKEVTISSPY